MYNIHKNESGTARSNPIPIPQDYDENEDAQISFQEFGLNGGLDHGTRTEFKDKFILDDNKLNYKLLEQDHPVLAEDGSPNLGGIISRLYKVFKVADIDKVSNSACMSNFF